MVGPTVLVFIFIALTVGLVLAVRIIITRLHDSVSEAVRDRAKTEGSISVDRRNAHEGRTVIEGAGGGQAAGRVLKQHFLRGEISKAEYDEKLRRLQIEEYLKEKG